MHSVPMADVAAFVLAGGRSSRMGSDKALLPFEGQTLLQRMLRTASQASNNVWIVGPKSSYAQFGDVVEDIYPGCGPLGGIQAALSATDTDLNLMLSADMPRMTPEFLRWLLAQARAAPEFIIVPHAGGGAQPLCAVYRRCALGAVEAALQKGEYKIGRLFSQVPTRTITEQEIVASGFSAIIFQNVNTPQEYDLLSQSLVEAIEPQSSGENKAE
jgi:molybdopterin-guanine dinucleotide biosynthesis protein A